MRYGVAGLAAGAIGVGWSEAGVRRVTLPQTTAQQALRLLQPGAGDSPAERDATLRDVARRLRRYFEGLPPAFDDLALDLSPVPPFSRAVLEAVRAIPRGQTRTYAQVAAAAGRPGAARAVGQAMANNPLCLVIPCHRVVASDGLGGFGAGPELKRRLLAMEGAPARVAVPGAPV